MYIIFSVIFLISFFTGILITMSDDKEKNVVEQKNKSSIQNILKYLQKKPPKWAAIQD